MRILSTVNENVVVNALFNASERQFRHTTIRRAGANIYSTLLIYMGARSDHIYPFKHINAFNIKKLNPKVNYLIGIRDPRDVIVSLAKWIISPEAKLVAQMAGQFNEQEYLKTKKLSLTQRIDLVINSNELKMDFKKALLAKEKHSKKILVVKFEDMIGPKLGGCSKQKQQETILKIIQHCKLSLNKDSLRRFYKILNRHPNVSVGQWRSILNKKQIHQIKEHYNPYILSFGYEQEADWDCFLSS